MYFTLVLVYICYFVSFQSSWQVDALSVRRCGKDSDCENYEACLYNEDISKYQCEDQRPFCINSEERCGPHALCLAANHSVSCVCDPGFRADNGDCIQECDSSQGCPANLACISGLCKDSCHGLTCGHNAVCKTKNHFPTCECTPGYIRSDSADITSDCLECKINADCPESQLCSSLHRCEDVCLTSICGPNSTCKTQRHHVTCECTPGYERVDNNDLTAGCTQGEDTTVQIVDVSGANRWRVSPAKKMSFTLKPQNDGLKLLRLRCAAAASGVHIFTVTVEPSNLSEHITSYTTQVNTVDKDEYQFVELPVSSSGRGIELRPNAQYTITVSCDTRFYVTKHNTSVLETKHFSMESPKFGAEYLNPVAFVSYIVSTQSSTSAFTKSALQYFWPETDGMWLSSRTLSFLLKTRVYGLEMMNLNCFGDGKGIFSYTINIQPIDGWETVNNVTYRMNSDYMYLYNDIPISRSDKRVILRPNTEYNITVSCDRDFAVFRQKTSVISTEYVILTFPKVGTSELSPVRYISYHRLTPIH